MNKHLLLLGALVLSSPLTRADIDLAPSGSESVLEVFDFDPFNPDKDMIVGASFTAAPMAGHTIFRNLNGLFIDDIFETSYSFDLTGVPIDSIASARFLVQGSTDVGQSGGPYRITHPANVDLSTAQTAFTSATTGDFIGFADLQPDSGIQLIDLGILDPAKTGQGTLYLTVTSDNPASFLQTPELDLVVVPEPSTWALTLGGLAALVLAYRWRRLAR